MIDKYNLQELEEKLTRCKNMKIEDISLDDVDDIKDIKIDKRKSSNERILDFIFKTKNPYVFKINGRLVRIRFSENGPTPTADECLSRMLENFYR